MKKSTIIFGAIATPMSSRNNDRRMYFSDRRVASVNFSILKFPPNILSPAIQKYCDTVPTGQIHPQNPFFMTREVVTAATNMMKAAGWAGSTIPVKRKNLNDISPAIGRKASTDGGRWTGGGPGA